MKRYSTFWLFANITACVILLSGCKTIRETVEVPVYIHDTTLSVKEVHDSTFVDRWHTIFTKGDTVFVTDQVTKIVTKIVTDTAYKVVEKPVTVTVEQVKEVEKPLRWWQKGLMWIGAIGLVILAIVVSRKRS